MVKLRLRRMGRKNRPIYKIVAADSRAPRDGRFIEEIGHYNPNPDPMEISFKETRALYWLNTGAQPTDTVRNLLSREGIILRWHLTKKKMDSDTIEQEVEKFKSKNEEKLQRERDKKIRRKENKAKNKAESQEKPVESSAQATATAENEAPDTEAPAVVDNSGEETTSAES